MILDSPSVIYDGRILNMRGVWVYMYTGWCRGGGRCHFEAMCREDRAPVMGVLAKSVCNFE